jgi:TolA-binding protein
MNRKLKIRALLGGSALLLSAPSWAQDPAADQVQAEPDQSDATADATIAAATPDEQSAKIELLQQQIEALQASIDEIKNDNVQQTPALKNLDWASKTKISGKAFLNVSNISQKSDGADSSQNGSQAELKRFYIGVDHKFDDMFSANLTTDFRYNSNGTSKDVLVYVKKAYLQAKFAPELFVRVGAADLPWVPFVEGLYGYRFIENTLIDRTK